MQNSENSSSKIETTLAEEDGYYVWNKGENLALSKYFSTKEFSCQCSFTDCKKQKISKALITRLDALRVDCNQPLIITSGYRCTKHQEEIRKSGVSTVVAKKSTHELGDAVDAKPKDGDIQKFLPLAAKQFTSIGLAKNFLHLDLRPDYRRWNY